MPKVKFTEVITGQPDFEIETSDFATQQGELIAQFREQLTIPYFWELRFAWGDNLVGTTGVVMMGLLNVAAYCEVRE